MTRLPRLLPTVLERRLRSRPWTALSLVALVLFAAAFLRQKESEWENVYARGARQLLEGRNLYEHGHAYLYPPFQAWATIPLALLPASLGRLAWLVVSLICLAFALRWAWRLSGGGSLEPANSAPRTEHAIALLGGACGFFALLNCFAHQQTDVLIAALLFGGCLSLRQARSATAAIAFGLAAAMKCTALLWAPYLAWRGQWRAAGLLVATVLFASFAADLTHPSPFGTSWLTEYLGTHLLGILRDNLASGYWASDLVYNQSLAGAASRWNLTTCEWTGGARFVVPRSPVATPAELQVLVYSLQIALVLLALAAIGRPGTLDASRPRNAERDAVRDALEFSVVLLLMLLLSPMSSKAHFGVLVLPGFLAARAALTRNDWVLRSLLGVAVAGALLVNKDLLGGRLYTLALWCGVTTWQTIALLVACMVLLVRVRMPAVAPMERADPCRSPERLALPPLTTVLS